MSKWRSAEDMTLAKTLDLPPFWLLGFLVLAWAMARVFPSTASPLIIAKGIAVLLCLAGLGLMFWALAAFRAHQTSVVPHQTPARIITGGPFAFSRNPIYLGDVLVLLGAVFWLGVWPALVLIPVFVWILTRRFIAPEERRMKEYFETEFTNFAQKTRRWL